MRPYSPTRTRKGGHSRGRQRRKLQSTYSTTHNFEYFQIYEVHVDESAQYASTEENFYFRSLITSSSSSEQSSYRRREAKKSLFMYFIFEFGLVIYNASFWQFFWNFFRRYAYTRTKIRIKSNDERAYKMKRQQGAEVSYLYTIPEW